MQKKINLQDLFLLRLRQERLPVTVFLMNGFQMRGTLPATIPSWWCWKATAGSR